jgi:hypothetical protein
VKEAAARAEKVLRAAVIRLGQRDMIVLLRASS